MPLTEYLHNLIEKIGNEINERHGSRAEVDKILSKSPDLALKISILFLGFIFVVPFEGLKVAALQLLNPSKKD